MAITTVATITNVTIVPTVKTVTPVPSVEVAHVQYKDMSCWLFTWSYLT